MEYVLSEAHKICESPGFFLLALLDEDHITDVFVADKILFIQSESRPTKQQRAELEYFLTLV